MIKIYRTSIDGCRSVRSFKTIKNARIFAYDCVGPQDLEGGHAAVSADGVVRITWVGVTRRELFGMPPSKARLNQTTTFYRRGMNLFCRQAGFSYDHERQQIGRVVEVNGCWKVRHNDGESKILFNEEATFYSFDDALAHAKRAYLDYLDYLENDAA